MFVSHAARGTQMESAGEGRKHFVFKSYDAWTAEDGEGTASDDDDDIDLDLDLDLDEVIESLEGWLGGHGLCVHVLRRHYVMAFFGNF